MVASTVPIPTLEFEQTARKRGYSSIAGVDEAGRGSIFGPVCVGMVVLPLVDLELTRQQLYEVRDSKKLARPKVYRLSDDVKAVARAWGVGQASAEEVDRFGIMGGIRRAAERALHMLEANSAIKVDYLLTDSTLPTPSDFPPEAQESHVKGDLYCLSIACAAILAKQFHDALVRALAIDYDAAYQLQGNVGYGTPAHIAAVRQLGPTPHHRKTFKPIAHTSTAD